VFHALCDRGYTLRVASTLFSEISRNPTGWLTFFTTTTLGATTAYFAWRTRQMQRAQIRQINRQADNELAEADAEMNYGVLTWFYWDEWRKKFDSIGAFTLYEGARSNLRRPDLPKVVRVLSFYLPEAEKDASEGIIRLYAARDALDSLIPRLAQPHEQLVDDVRRVEDGLRDADLQMRRAVDAIKRKRSELRRI